jgi:hypothetical protein
MMTSENRETPAARGPSGAPQLRTVPIGTKLSLRDKSIVEIIGNPGDGGWVNVRYVESPSGSPAVGDEEWVFVTDVRDIVEA